jgi:hypothetical protein
MESNISLSIDLVDIKHELLCLIKIFLKFLNRQQPASRRRTAELPVPVLPELKHANRG